MSVIRPDHEGSNKAHLSLGVLKRPREADSADEATDKSRAEGRRDAARDAALLGSDEELSRAARLTSLLHRAGIGSESLVSVQSGNTRSTQAVSADSVVKAQAKVDELQLGPVQAPRIELTQRLSESALSFTQNVDRAMTNHLVQTAAAMTAQHIELDRSNTRLNLVDHGTATERDGTQRQLLTPEQARAQANENMLARIVPQRATTLTNANNEEARGLTHLVTEPTHGDTTALADANRAPHLDAAEVAHGVATGTGGNAHTILTAPEHTKIQAGTGQTAAAAANNRFRVDGLAGIDRKNTGSGNVANAEQLGKRLTLLDMSNLSSDQMLAEFLKLNINDPNSNVETQNKLYTLASEMRKQAIEEAKKRIERAQELMKEAQKYADQVQKYADMAGMIGIFAAFLGPLGAIISGIMQIAVAVAQYTAQMKILDAKEEKNNAERFKLMGDMHQDQVKETAEVINTIMELKNQMIESVIQMLNASFSTRQQLMSAAMAR